MRRLAPDLRTLAHFVADGLAPARPPRPRPWETRLADPDVGPVRLTGDLRETAGARELYLILHGLGGGPKSRTCLRGASAVAARGASSLCLSLRGSDRLGEDLYNIALTADLAAAVASPELEPYERVHVLGYSMGGHVALHYARGPLDPRVRSVAAICTPLDLGTAQRHIDSPRAWLYRRHVLGGLKSIYAAVAARGRRVPSDPAAVAAVRTIYEWDRLVIAPRFGYAGPEDYYAALSVAPHLDSLSVPALLVADEDDPVVPAGTIRPFLPNGRTRGAPLQVRFVRGGGHVAFPRRLDLGYGHEQGLEPQVIAWCAAQP